MRILSKLWAIIRLGLVLAIIGGVVLFLSQAAPGFIDGITDGSSGETGIPGQNSKEAAINAEIHERINEIRDRRGLPKLAYDDELKEIAQNHSEDMAIRQYYAHEGPDGNDFQDRYRRAGYNCRISTVSGSFLVGAENIFKMSYSGSAYRAEEIAKRAVNGWMDSRGHRKNILNQYWNSEGIGVAIAKRDDGTTEVYITQNFC